MKIRFIPLNSKEGLDKREFAFKYGHKIKTLWIALYYFGFQVTFGAFDPYKVITQIKEKTVAQMNNKCLYCGLPLIIHHSKMTAVFHRECREEGRKLLRRINAHKV